MYDVTMPKLSDSMATGRIVAWKVAEGDKVREGDILAEVESDKAVMELECFRDGTVAEILHDADAEVPIGEVIARIAGKGEETPAEPSEERTPAEPAEGEPPVEREEAPEPEAAPAAPREPAAATPPERPESGRKPISPYARKLAQDKGIDYRTLKGSGPGGRIVARDVEALGEEGTAKPKPAARLPAAETPVAPSEDELPPVEVDPDEADVEEAPFRLKTQARRVVASQHVIPHFYVTRAVDVTPLLARARGLKDELGATLTHVVMHACVRTLRDHPQINRSYDRGRIIRWKSVRLGLAVDTDAGLTVAVLADAQGLSLRDLAERTRALVDKARGGKLTGAERRHATFTITNLGMLDVEQFEPIINPPSAVTLAVASALPSAIVRDGGLHVGHLMRLTAACDHRIVDGAMAARFLHDLRLLLEDPDRLLEGV
ncbi:MAG: 2-oxo acid dehydrogenase subunit E2 [Phycisphaerae bacterium]|nr:2-oxo acid dehydrogenase subunit E2 [Phycisphaerae bacterium]